MIFHRIKVEKYIGRDLFTPELLFIKYSQYKIYEELNEVVHHIDGNRDNNELSNFYVFRNNAHHIEYHRQIKRWAIGLSGKTLKEKIEYLKTFPDLFSNLDELKNLNERGLALSYYIDD